MRSSCTSPARSAANCTTSILAPRNHLAGSLEKEKKTCVPRHFVVVDPHRDPHAAIDIPLVRLVEKSTPHVTEVLANLGLPQIFDSSVQRPAVVPRDARRLLNEAPEQIASLLGVYGFGADTDPVSARFSAGGRCAMGSHLASRRPHDQNEPIVYRLGGKNGGVGRVEPIAVPAYPPLRRIDLLARQPVGGRAARPSRSPTPMTM